MRKGEEYEVDVKKKGDGEEGWPGLVLATRHLVTSTIIETLGRPCTREETGVI